MSSVRAEERNEINEINNCNVADALERSAIAFNLNECSVRWRRKRISQTLAPGSGDQSISLRARTPLKTK